MDTARSYAKEEGLAQKVYNPLKTDTSWVFKVWILFLLAITAVGAYAGIRVLVEGLGITGLSNQAFWGLWIVNDNAFIAMSAGAFTMATMIYVLKMKRFKALGRLAVFVGMLGYTVAMLNVFFDLGRPDRFWHALVYWNPHSLLWEVIISITIYMFVLTIEILPIVGESDLGERFLPTALIGLAKKLKKITPLAALIGLIISVMHQGALGGMLGVIRGRAYWHGAILPVLWLTSAVAAGLSTLVILTIITEKLMNRKLISIDLLYDLAKIIFLFFGIAFIMRGMHLFELFYHQMPGRVSAMEILTGSLFFKLEIIIGFLVPLLLFILIFKKKTKSYLLLFLTGLGVVFGAYALRWNIIMPGALTAANPHPDLIVGLYQPTWVEWWTAAGALALGALIYSVGIRILPLFKIDNTEMEA